MPNLPSEQSSVIWSAESSRFSLAIERSQKLERPIDILCFDLPTVFPNRPSLAKFGESLANSLSTGQSVGLPSKYFEADRGYLPPAPTARIDSFAAPLAPMRERDLKIMESWFNHSNMNQIEADFTHYLLQLWPEPCWEDEIFDFLGEFL
jgi:hypothetical protein